ncbi:MAG TPA: ATP-binding protein [Anaeromyxobacteraceae bacterium]|nr:ATP-binding protein [Anaeromyxobacteraceae bacterium]
MRRGTWGAVLTTVAVLAGVIALAVGTAHRDRAALVKEFGDEHLGRLRIAIHEIETELADVRLHLAFAAKLVDAANTGKDQRRELEALVAVVRSYRTIVVYDVQGRERVVAVDPAVAGSWSRQPFAEAVRETALAAISRQVMAISEPLGDPSAPWHRAFAAPLVRDGVVRGAIVILVDQQGTFDRLRLAALQPQSKLLLIGPHGRVAPLTEPAVTALVGEGAQGGPLADLLASMRAGHTGTMELTPAQTRALGLGRADALAAFAPIRTEDAGHWSVAVIDSTAALEAQEDAIILRMALLAVAFGVALGALSVYLVVSARKAIAVQERLRGAEEVARMREKAEKILENVPVAVLALDAAGRISGMNVAFRDRVGAVHAGDTLEGAFAAGDPGALDAVRDLVERARASSEIQRQVTQPLALAGGSRFFAVHAVPLHNPLQDMTLLLVLEDVTELRGLTSQLLRAEKLATVGVLASGIAHEVGTPLGVVRGRTEMLAAKLGPTHPESSTTAVILDEIDRISRTIRELLDFARVSQADVAPVDVRAVSSIVVDLLTFEARKRKVALALDVAEGLPALAANADQLKQVLVNLVLNGLDACRPGGHVTVRAQPGAGTGSCSLEVVDDGAGIPEDLRHRVFDPFFTTKKRGKGTGLGLTVAAQIVRNHGGEIDLDSAEGRGTRVVIAWPEATHREEPEDIDDTAARRANPGR